MPDEGPAHNIEPEQNERKLFFVLCLTVGVMVLEVVGGYLSGSLALLADAGHMFTDTAGLLMSWLAMRFGKREPDSQRTYGYQRLKILAAYTNGVLLFFLTFVIASEGIERLRHPHAINGQGMLIIAAIGLVTNIASFFILKGRLSDLLPHQHGHAHHHEHDHGHHHHDLNIHSAVLHVLSDLLGSIGAIAAAIIITTTGWTVADPLLSLLICVLIFFYAWGLVKRTVHILIEGAPDSGLPEKMRKALLAGIKGLIDVHHIHVWSLTEKQPLATLHVTLHEAEDTQAALKAIQKLLEEQFQLDHATIQIEKGPCTAVHS
ncbi:MAG TPA: cation diffusion facilitator family transporter [Alphaproteobacteria bacterium]|nr:cation diffusion facilitator family transporter [Alphaproteobacteria bacterium]